MARAESAEASARTAWVHHPLKTPVVPIAARSLTGTAHSDRYSPNPPIQIPISIAEVPAIAVREFQLRIGVGSY